MNKEYQVALVASDGHAEYGPYPIVSDNAANAAEEALLTRFMPGTPGTVVAVKLPNSERVITFSCGTINY